MLSFTLVNTDLPSSAWGGRYAYYEWYCRLAVWGIRKLEEK